MVFQVGGTKKGGMPVTTEKRPRGKTVTVIGNVKGDKAELIRLLKSSLGCGGHAIGHDRVEIQGDHASAIQDLLLKHGGAGAMKGVAGLKPPREKRRTDEAEKAEETKASLATEKVEAREDARRRRARESRQRSLKEAVLVKPESTRAFHAFCAMMKQWRYWDQDYDRLHEMHHRHVRELDDARGANHARLGEFAGAAILDADDSFLDDNERMQSGARSVALETMRSNLDALNREITQSRADQGVESWEGAKKSAYESLRALGMIAEPSPFRQTREERLAESRRNAAEARARALNEARVSAARRKEKEKENVFRGGAVSTSKSAYASAGGGGGSGGGRFRSSRAGGASVKKHGKGDASRPTLGFTAARKRGGLYRGLFDDDDEDDEETRSGSEDDGTASATARWDSTPGFASRDDGGGFSFGPIAGAGATPAWAVSLEAVGDGGDGVPAESLSREELDLREALRQSLLEAERATRREQVGLHVECGDVWGELSEEEALALAMELSEQDERRRLREERDLYEAYQAGAYGSVDGSEDDFEEARFAYAEETPNDVEFSAARDDADADLAEALRLSALESERERVFARSSLMPETMDEDAALREALRLSALESGEANGENAVGSARVSPRGAKETACQWAAAHLGAFTGESDNSVLAEYVVSMSRAEVEEFLGESFGDAEAAEAFARTLEEIVLESRAEVLLE
jgi:translation initiation factor 1 (eIF-1/SUI1)